MTVFTANSPELGVTEETLDVSMSKSLDWLTEVGKSSLNTNTTVP